MTKLSTTNLRPNVSDRAFFAYRLQHCFGHNILSYNSRVTSGLLQGFVLSPLQLLVFINLLSDCIPSSIRSFADDCVMYCTIHSPSDILLILYDLNVLSGALTGFLPSTMTNAAILFFFPDPYNHPITPTICRVIFYTHPRITNSWQ